jgi:hypothetical protein
MLLTVVQVVQPLNVLFHHREGREGPRRHCIDPFRILLVSLIGVEHSDSNQGQREGGS